MGGRVDKRVITVLILISVLVLLFITLQSCHENPLLTDVKTIVDELRTVKAPIFTVKPGYYAEDQQVGLYSDTGGATIYYTTDGSEPTTSSQVYAGPISVAPVPPSQSISVTIKALAAKEEMINSKVVSSTFIVDYSLTPYTLTVNSSTGGSTDPSGSLTVYHGIAQDISATANSEYNFVNWTKTAGSGNVSFGDANALSTTVTITDGDATIQANFVLKTYSLTMTGNNCSTTPSGTVIVDHGAWTVISAAPNTGYHFVNWTEIGRASCRERV